MTGRFAFDPSEVRLGDAAPWPELLGLEPGRALHVEVGFGKDVHLLKEAERDPDGVRVGIEISRKKAESFCRKAARAGLRNVRCFHGDVRVVLARLLPPGSVASFTALFPDPWPKRRHRKHRWIQLGTAGQIATALRPGGLLVCATDFDDYAEQMEAVFRAAGLVLESRLGSVPDRDRTLFAERFERLGESVTWMRWRKAGGGPSGAATSSSA